MATPDIAPDVLPENRCRLYWRLSLGQDRRPFCRHGPSRAPKTPKEPSGAGPFNPIQCINVSCSPVFFRILFRRAMTQERLELSCRVRAFVFSTITVDTFSHVRPSSHSFTVEARCLIRQGRIRQERRFFFQGGAKAQGTQRGLPTPTHMCKRVALGIKRLH